MSKRRTRQNPPASASGSAPSQAAPSTGKAPTDTAGEVTNEVTIEAKNNVADIHLAPLPVEAANQTWLDSLPEKTRLEMRAGRAALIKSEEAMREMNTITKQLAEEMFSNRAKEVLTTRRLKLRPDIWWGIEAIANKEDNRWDVKVTITYKDKSSDPVTIIEPYSQFPSDEMIAYLMVVGG